MYIYLLWVKSFLDISFFGRDVKQVGLDGVLMCIVYVFMYVDLDTYSIYIYIIYSHVYRCVGVVQNSGTPVLQLQFMSIWGGPLSYCTVFGVCGSVGQKRKREPSKGLFNKAPLLNPGPLKGVTRYVIWETSKTGRKKQKLQNKKSAMFSGSVVATIFLL